MDCMRKSAEAAVTAGGPAVAGPQAVVVTTIHPPTPAMHTLAAQCRAGDVDLLVVGDAAGPGAYALDGARYCDLAAQRRTGLRFARLCPEGHYARKAVGYLLAMRAGAQVIAETDDDNAPLAGFLAPMDRHVTARHAVANGWTNVYPYFDPDPRPVWPRGLPLDAIHVPPPAADGLAEATVDCPIQQGLADGNPDVDAVYRLTRPLPVRFCMEPRHIALGRGSWCPFNSQNTRWWREAFALMYLPVTCSFRMTDIWRSFVAQRIAWENGWSILFHQPTVTQDRNDHDLMADFRQEVPGYLENARIARLLEDAPLRGGAERIGDDMVACYRALIAADILSERERPLIDAWLADLETAPGGRDA